MARFILAIVFLAIGGFLVSEFFDSRVLDWVDCLRKSEGNWQSIRACQ